MVASKKQAPASVKEKKPKAEKKNITTSSQSAGGVVKKSDPAARSSSGIEVVSSAQVKKVGIPVSKMKLSADAIRGKKVHYALGFLTQNRRAANPWLKNLLNSAIANALQKNTRLQPDQLYIKTIVVNQERPLKRMVPRAMGRGNVIKKRYSQVAIELALI